MHRVLATALILTSLAHPVAAIVTSETPGSHVVTPGEPMFGLDLDGVAIIGTAGPFGPPAAICTGTLVTDQHVLSAAHCFDQDSDGQLESPAGPFPNSVVFELPSGFLAIEYQIESVQVPGNWPQVNADIAVVTLEEAAPAEIPRYPLYGGSNEVGQPIVIVGYGDPGHGATGEVSSGDRQPTKRAGLNRYDAIRGDQPGVQFLAYDFDSGLPENNSLAITGFASDLGFGADEGLQASGDSGGPAFIGGAIAGVASFGASLPAADVNDRFDASWGEGGFDTRVSMFRDFILDATNGTAVFVPEPSSGMLLASASFMILMTVRASWICE